MIYLYILKWFEGVYLANSILSVFWDTTKISHLLSHTVIHPVLLPYSETIFLYFLIGTIKYFIWIKKIN